jgi:tripartite-type tricarboxylate transporter receptor subunit TctC
VAELHEGLRWAVNDPQIQGRLDQLGVRAEFSTPNAMKDFVRAEIKRWSEVIDPAGAEKIN